MVSDANRQKMYENMLYAISVQEAIEAAHQHEPAQLPLTFNDDHRPMSDAPEDQPKPVAFNSGRVE
jgi:hypothetical protein